MFCQLFHVDFSKLLPFYFVTLTQCLSINWQNKIVERIENVKKLIFRNCCLSTYNFVTLTQCLSINWQNKVDENIQNIKNWQICTFCAIFTWLWIFGFFQLCLPYNLQLFHQSYPYFTFILFCITSSIFYTFYSNFDLASSFFAEFCFANQTNFPIESKTSNGFNTMRYPFYLSKSYIDSETMR